MIRAQSAYHRVVAETRHENRGEQAVSDTYEQDDCRYANVLRAIRAGECDEEITDRYPEFKKNPDVLTVYRKIVNGTLSRGSKMAPRFDYGAGKCAKARGEQNHEVDTTFIKHLKGISNAHVHAVINMLQQKDDIF